jgi:predicted transcriptional regulator
MKGLTVQNTSRTFRLPSTLDAELVALANAVVMHPSTLIRDAVRLYVRFYMENPKELDK